MFFKNKNIVIGVTGGIAAYKSAEIIRLFKKEGAEVRVVMTESAKEFITPLTLQTVSGNSLLNANAELAMSHIELAKWADIILIAPCTAETMAKITHGRAEDLMGAIILASKASIYIAPAMNMNMWSDKSTQENFKILLLLKTPHGQQKLLFIFFRVFTSNEKLSGSGSKQKQLSIL